MSDVSLSVVPESAAEAPADAAMVIAPSIPATDPPAEVAAEAEPGRATGPSYALPDRREAVVESVHTAREVPPGLRERLSLLVQQAPTLDATGEPLLATRHVLDLLAQGLPPVLRTQPPTAPQRPPHPAGDAFFATSSDELSDQQADEIARTQLARAGLLRTA